MVPPGIKAIPHRAIPVRPAPIVGAIPVRELPPIAKEAPKLVRARAVTMIVLPVRNRTGYDLAAPTTAAITTGNSRPVTTATSSFALPEPQPLAAWRLTDKFPEVTARAGARYAVGEALADHRRVGPPRSMLDAMLVLRIDGKNESPPLSLGGGVAGAMWKAGNSR
ncbi:MAG: hypothetical protein ABW023_12700 [Sphingomonas sp.]